MPDNRVSASLSQADRQAVLDAIGTIRQKLPFLVDLTPDERRTLPKMGDSSRGFVTPIRHNSDQVPCDNYKLRKE